MAIGGGGIGGPGSIGGPGAIGAPHPADGGTQYPVSIFPPIAFSVPTVMKTVGFSVDALIAAAATIVRSVGKNVDALAAAGVAVIKSVGKTISPALAVLAAVISAFKTIVAAVTAFVDLSAAITKSVGKRIAALIAAGVSITKAVAHRVSAASATAAVVITKSVGKILTPALVALLAVISAFKAYLASVTAFVTLAASTRRSVGKRVTALISAATSVVRSTAHRVTTAASAGVVTVKSVGKIIAAALVNLAVSITANVGEILQSVTVFISVAAVRQASTVGKNVDAFVSEAASVIRSAGKRVTAAMTTGYAANTGAVIAGAGNSVNTGSEQWANAGNITADDAAYAVAQHVVGVSTSDTLKGSSFGFALPGGANIKGIEVTYQLKAVLTAGTVTVNGVNVGKSDSTLGTPINPAQALTASDVNYTFGGPTSLWGLTWSAAEINADTFQCRLTVEFNGSILEAHADAAWVTVYYTAGTPSIQKAISHILENSFVSLLVSVIADAITVTQQAVTALMSASVSVARTVAFSKTVTALIDAAVSISMLVIATIPVAVSATITAAVTLGNRAITHGVVVPFTALVSRVHAFVCYVQDLTSWADAAPESDSWSTETEQEDAAEEQQTEPQDGCCGEE